MSRAYCSLAPGHAIHGTYHDTEYGFPVEDETALFERLALEIMQAGLSWEIVLKKRKAINKAFDRFKISKVSAYTAKDVKRLLGDDRIIRNQLKIEAIIHNANVILGMRKSHKGFAQWLALQKIKEKSDWIKLFKRTFKFTGGEITGEFLMSIGYLAGAHETDCPVYKRLIRSNPFWIKNNYAAKR